MAKDKKSFILYADQTGLFEKLTDAKAGKLIKYIFDYVNDKDPSTEDILLQIAFEPIKQQLKRDLKDWEQERSNRSQAGEKGMASRWGKQENITNDNKNNSVINPITGITDNANVTVNVNDNVTVKKKREGFAPPAIEDVVVYMSETIDEFSAMGEAKKFINYYSSNGWMVGKNKMKSWRGAAAGWLDRKNNFKNKDDGKQLGTSGERVEAAK